MVPEGRVLHRVLSRQGDAAEQNEEEDQVGEDRVIDNAVALEAEPAWGAGEKEGGASGGKGSGNLGPRSPGLFPWLFPPPCAPHAEDARWFGAWAPQDYHCWVMRTTTPTPTMRHVCRAGCSSTALSPTVNF